MIKIRLTLNREPGMGNHKKVSGFSVQVSAQPPAKRTADQIEKETDERPTSNVQRPTLNNEFCHIKWTERSDTILRHSIFVIRYSAVRF